MGFGFLFIAAVLFLHRRKSPAAAPDSGNAGAVAAAGHASPEWRTSLRQTCLRVLALVFRMLCLTVPLMIGVEWLMKNGLFSWWEEHVPDWVNRIFPAELMSIVAAQMGGLVQAAGVAANLRSHGMVTSSQILLAMLVAWELLLGSNIHNSTVMVLEMGGVGICMAGYLLRRRIKAQQGDAGKQDSSA